MSRTLLASLLALAGVSAVLGGCGSDGAATTPRGKATTPRPLPPALTTPRGASAAWNSVTRFAVTAGDGYAGLHFGPKGDAFARWSGGAKSDNDTYRSRLLPIGADGKPGRESLIDRALSGGPYVDETGAATTVGYQSTEQGDSGDLSIQSIAAGGAPGRTRRVAQRYPHIGTAQFAENDRGDSVLAWQEYSDYPPGNEGYQRARYRVAVGHHGQLGKAVTLEQTNEALEPYDPTMSVAINADGQAVVAAVGLRYDARNYGRIIAWTAAAQGTFAGPLVVGDRANASELEATVTTDGRSIVAWAPPNGGEEPGRPWVVYAATLAPGATTFSPRQIVDPGTAKQFPISGLHLAAGPEGTATLAWSGVRARGDPAFVSDADHSGRFGPRQQLAADGSVAGLAVRADGAAVVTVGPSNLGVHQSASQTVQAYVRPAATSVFGPAETLPIPLEVSADQGAPNPSFDPITGQPTVAYTTGRSSSAASRLVVIRRIKP